MLLGCIGDDFTGSSDLANTLAKEGMKVVQYTGLPQSAANSDVEAGVISLKTRSIDPQGAIEQSLAALRWLQQQGCKQFFFKYCSTFDSTPEGNIGPVAEALTAVLGAQKVIFCPAFPGTGRSVYQGHLFVNDKLLNKSGMENHPLTPMTDADLRVWLAAQTTQSIGHVASADVFAGSEAISRALQSELDHGNNFIVVDAIRDEDLREIGKAASDLKLITGGSGIALGLPANFGIAPLQDATEHWQGQNGKAVALSGSCSIATRNQLKVHGAQHPLIEIDVEAVICDTASADDIADQLMATTGIPVAFSSADPQVVKNVQAKHGREQSAEKLENFFASLARALVAKGVERLITAGGETSGAVVKGLELESFEIGPEIDPGVPALRARDNLVVALKSGNFGAPEFFEKAARVLGEGA